jgi:hypothetical protein
MKREPTYTVNIFGELELQPIVEMFYCPAGCEYNRLGSRDLDSFNCIRCQREMVNEEELDIIEGAS